MNQAIEFNSRRLILQDLRLSPETLSLLETDKFCAMFPAYSEIEVVQSLQIAQYFISLNCVEFCAVGSYSSELEDQLDMLLEDQLGVLVATTSFVDEIEASEYFIFAADGAESKILIALVCEHKEIVNNLIQMIAESNGTEVINVSNANDLRPL